MTSLQTAARLLLPLALVTVGCANETADEPAPGSSESAIFGLHVPHVALIVAGRVAKDDPICFEVDGWQNNALLDVSGGQMYNDNSETPVLLVSAAHSETAKDYFAIGKVCAGTDGGLYSYSKAFVPWSPTAPASVSGEYRIFRIGELKGVAVESITARQHIDEKNVAIDGDFKFEFRDMQTQLGVLKTFTILSTRPVKQVTTGLVFAKLH